MRRIVAIGLGALAIAGCLEPRTDPDFDPGGSDRVASDRRDGATAMVEVEDADRLADSWRWNRRVVLAAGSESDLSRQATLVGADWTGWGERDLELVLLTRGGGLIVERFVDGGPVGNTFDATVETGLERRFDLEPVSDGLQVVLIGKDGGVKARWSEPVSPSAVFDLVDAMPMRMREMREDEK